MHCLKRGIHLAQVLFSPLLILSTYEHTIIYQYLYYESETEVYGTKDHILTVT